ncbi:MAG: hypothetical protein RLZZ444_4298 [Pseudomonadota bacterium]|jgi:hypothetical protein
MSHPYSSLPSKAFWSSAVADRNFLEFSDIYTKKYEIRPEDRIVTAGSCFAQHISRKLVAAGFRYMDYETAPPALPPEIAAEYNYGVYSARYANVYTTRQLLQLFNRAFEGFVADEDIWRDKGRIFDPFRPTIEPGGFVDEDDFYAARESHMRAVRKVFTESDIFIFTLGLTEAWESRIDGTIFPVCPGTQAGTFDPMRHAFHNFSYPEVYDDLKLLIQKVRSVNQNVKFLLTVSPVPLTATASGDHVMVATSHSKSILRAVAGQLALEDEGIDYYPSYELVAAPPIRASLYGSNLRTVVSSGVDIVMRHFFTQHVPTKKVAANPAAGGPVKRGGKPKKKPKHIDDIICEEELLEQFAQ